MPRWGRIKSNVKGHAGHPENERCDELARAAAMSPTQDDIGYQTEA